MRKSILLLALCCLFGSIGYTQQWVTFTKSTPEPPIINLIESNNQQVEFNVEVCGMYKNDITEEGEPFQRIEIPNAGKTSETGSPELTYIRQLIAIPECDDIILTVNITCQTDFSNYNIYPAPGYEEVEEPGGTVYMQEVFTKDETVYAQNTYLPGMNAEIVSTGYLRDQKYAEVFLYPIQFNPVIKHINVFTHYEVTLDFVNPTTPVNVNTGIFNNVATNTILNYVSSGITASINDNMQGDGNVQWFTLTDTAEACTIVADYLIICAEPFFEPSNPDSEVLRIANHRATYNGFDVAILNAETIYLDLDFEYTHEEFMYEQKIRTCIRRIYEGANAQHTYDGKLGYVLLVGDVEDQTNLGMPISYEYTFSSGSYNINYASDYYYSCITKQQAYDPVGDLFIGRFCVDNNLENGLIELQNMVSKTIFFESEYIFEDWRQNAVFSNGYIEEWLQNAFIEYYTFIEELIQQPYNIEILNYYTSSGQEVWSGIIQSLNNGCFLKVYNGHGDVDKWLIGDGYNLSEFNFNVQIHNENKYPIAIGLSCYTGYLDYDEDCLAEFSTTYPDKGFVGYLGSSRLMWTIIGGSIANLGTSIPHAIFNNLSHIAGEFILEGKIIALFEVEKFGYNYFGDPALNIMAQGFEVTQDITLAEFTTISSEITVRSGAYLTVPSNGKLNFEGDGKLIIEEGAGFIAIDAIVQGQSINNKIIVKGHINLHSAELSSQSGQTWAGIYFDNEANNYVVYNTIVENCLISGKSKKLTVQNSTFNNSGLKYQKGDLVIKNSTFNNSKIEAVNGNYKSSYVEIKSNCNVQNCEQESAIFIDGYYNYSIDDCTISGNYGDGIGIYNSGSVTGIKNISNNTIIYNGLETSSPGILVYHSYAKIFGNQLIMGNYYGIESFDNSNVSVRGNINAGYPYETQQIKENQRNQIYASQNSFPYEVSWNAIIDDYNEYPLVYYRSQVFEELDVKNNYWGNNFEPSIDLYPFEYYLYEPIWQLNGGGGTDGAEAMYNSAHEKIDAQDFSGAKNDLQQIVLDYPASKYAQAALRELFSLEEDAGDDYTALRTYYYSETNIQNNPDLSKLADYLMNFCEIKLENWPTAIAWFENVIQNPESMEDSIFAIIDLGYTYFLMENGGLKSAYTGSMTEHIPESMEQFEEKRDYLLSLLPGDQISKSLQESLSVLKTGELLQNIPNPFIGITDIYYNLENDVTVCIIIYDYSGRKLKTIKGKGEAGINKVQFDSSGLPSGIYFYNLEVDGSLSDSKKMTIIK